MNIYIEDLQMILRRKTMIFISNNKLFYSYEFHIASTMIIAYDLNEAIKGMTPRPIAIDLYKNKFILLPKNKSIILNLLLKGV